MKFMNSLMFEFFLIFPSFIILLIKRNDPIMKLEYMQSYILGGN